MYVDYELQERVLHSAFDVATHKKVFVHYLEVIIDEDGTIIYGVPSHQEVLIRLACRKLGVDREALNKLCPKEYYFDFMEWLSLVSGAIAVWEYRTMGHKYNESQIEALSMLKREGLYLGDIPVI